MPAVDPRFQEEPTFATTLTGIDELRRQHGAQDDDWPRYKISVVNAIRSGARVEQEIVDLRAALEQCARRTAVSTLVNKVAALEEAAERRKGTVRWVVDHFWQIMVVLLTALIAHRWK